MLMKFQKKILLIEDDQNLGLTIQNILIDANFDVCYVENGVLGIRKAFQYNPDLILCDINMEPIDGFHVYKLLEESSMLTRIPFVFLTGSSEVSQIRYGLSLGADDYLIKPVFKDTLIQSIEKRLEKFSAIRDEAFKSFNRLLEVAPVGMLLFDGKKIFKANSVFKKMATIVEDEKGLLLADFIDEESFGKVEILIKNQLKNGSKKQPNTVVKFKVQNSFNSSVNLVVVEFEQYSNYTLFLGLFTPESEKVSGYADEIYKLLKLENIQISTDLGQKITELFKNNRSNSQNTSDSIFTTRENQILNLSMEGLPIKVIADRLNISDRTVEKHRTRLMEKTGAGNMIEVIVYALKNNLIEI